MRRLAIIGFSLLAFAAPAMAEPPARPPARIDYRGFTQLAAEVAPYRAQRLVQLAAFNEMARQRGVLVLDARSAGAYQRGHIRGAVNLPLTDFTAPRLAEVIGADTNRRILIYCNNNFAGDVEPVRTKMIRLALNISTFINLYGYGYRNVFELANTVAMDDQAVGWVAG